MSTASPTVPSSSSTRFNAGEILEFAVAIERTGEEFYRRAEEKFEDPKVRETFRFLALEEVAHERTFAAMLDRVGRFDAGDAYNDDYFAYLHAYVDNVVFSQKKAMEMLSAVTDAETAIRFAMQRETDSILFYLELRNLVPEAERAALDHIVEEERSHFRKLAALVGAKEKPA